MSFRPIWGRPKLITDWNEQQHEQDTHWTALFYDLMVVAAVSAVSDPFIEAEEEEHIGLEEHGGLSTMHVEEDEITQLLPPVAGGITDALLKFLSITMIWGYLNDVNARFEDESLAGHLAFFVHAFGMACASAGCVGDLAENFHLLGWGICFSRIGVIVLHLRPAMYISRARVHCAVRISQNVIVTVVVALALIGNVGIEFFRLVLAATIFFDCACIPMMVVIKTQRLPIHVEYMSDRVKDGIMVVFGEAILMLTLKRHIPTEHSHYYVALALALWLVYGMALHEYHIFPTAEDHALRRSVFAGTSWMYLSFILQCFLLGVSVGVKRVYALVGANSESVDKETLNLLVWGITGTLLSVIAMRFCSFGWGRHPSPYDPPRVRLIKISWWVSMVVLSGVPYVLSTVIGSAPDPLVCLMTLGLMMAAIILLEAAFSNGVSYYSGLYTGQKGSYLIHCAEPCPANANYESIPGDA